MHFKENKSKIIGSQAELLYTADRSQTADCRLRTVSLRDAYMKKQITHRTSLDKPKFATDD
jgi:hypothetical protein